MLSSGVSCLLSHFNSSLDLFCMSCFLGRKAVFSNNLPPSNGSSFLLTIYLVDVRVDCSNGSTSRPAIGLTESRGIFRQQIL